MWQFPAAWLGLWLLLPGCAAQRSHLDRALLSEQGSPGRNGGVAERYCAHCPDELELAIAGRADLSGRQVIGADGRVELGSLGRLRVEGRTIPEITQLVADTTGLSPERIQVRVAAFNSQQVYLFGQVKGLQRPVAYQGQETVLDLLQRTGGITPGAASNHVYVIRPHIGEGKPPEVFRIDLQGIVKQQDQQSNLRLMAFDEIYVGETNKSCLEKCVPPCLRPMYEKICGLSRKVPWLRR